MQRMRSFVVPMCLVLPLFLPSSVWRPVRGNGGSAAVAADPDEGSAEAVVNDPAAAEHRSCPPC